MIALKIQIEMGKEDGIPSKHWQLLYLLKALGEMVACADEIVDAQGTLLMEPWPEDPISVHVQWLR